MSSPRRYMKPGEIPANIIAIFPDGAMKDQDKRLWVCLGYQDNLTAVFEVYPTSDLPAAEERRADLTRLGVTFACAFHPAPTTPESEPPL